MQRFYFSVLLCVTAHALTGLPERSTSEIHVRNVASDVDGGGLNCVACVETIANREGFHQLKGLRDWAKKRKGGGWKRKLEDDVQEFCRERGFSAPEFMNLETSSLQTVEEMVQRGWLMVSDHGGPTSRYASRVNAAVVLFFLDSQYAGIYDPNWPGEAQWMSRSTFRERFLDRGESGWAFQLVRARP